MRTPEEHDEERRRDVRGWVLVDAAARRAAVRLEDGRFVRLVGAPTPHRLDRLGRPIGGGRKAKVLHAGRHEMVEASSIAHIYEPGARVPTA